MKTIKTTLSSLKTSYDINSICPMDKILFMDIETTGFVAKTSYLYLIGCIYYKNGNWEMIQWFGETQNEESQILLAFTEFCQNYTHLVHFNGNQFDIPYLKEKCSTYQIEPLFISAKGVDLYKRIAPFKKFLKLPDCKQKTIELFLNTNREDTYSGGELIQVYEDYQQNPSKELLDKLILHNAEDISGLVSMLVMLNYPDLYTTPVQVTKVQGHYYTDIDGIKRQELLIKLKLSVTLPVTISYRANNCYFTGFGNEGHLKAPILETELKYFYSNYKEYYYLPTEDVAIHKSVASYVENSHRIKATAANCYTRKQSTYLQQWDTIFTPFYKKEYKDSALYFELTEESKKDRTLFRQYALHILEMMLLYK